MKIRLSIICFAFLTLALFVGCPQTEKPAQPSADPPPSETGVGESATPETPSSIPENVVASDVLSISIASPETPAVSETSPLALPVAPEPVAEPEPAATPPVVVPEAPQPPQETPEETAVRERVQQLGGTIRKNTAGRIVGVVVERNELTVADMQLIGKLTDLESIRLFGPAVSDAYVEALSGLTKLKSVDIENSTITDRSLEILKTLPEIETLALRRNLGFSDRAVALFAEFPSLQVLRILYNGFTPMALYDLELLTSIRVLDLRGLPVGDDTLIFLSGLENLEELRIRSDSVTNDGLEQLKGCTKLRILELQDSAITAGSGAIFKEMENLRFLRIFRCPGFGSEAIAELGVLTQLETLELRDQSCSNEALQALKPLVNLSSVEFSELRGVDTATILEVLQSYPKLHTVRIFAIPIDDTIPEYLATLPAMRRVLLPATAITDKGLEALTALERLETLDIHGNKQLITLEGAKVLGKLNDLRRLIIPETLDDPALRAIILENSPRCVFTVNTYTQEG